MNTLNFQRLNKHAIAPEYKSAGAACFDIHALVLNTSGVPDTETVLWVHHDAPHIIGTGLRIEIPDGHVLLILSRSGHGFKNNVRLSNCVGVIDSDYTGELKVKLACDTMSDELLVKHGMAIAQGMIVPCPQYKFNEITEWSKQTARGDGGFGSTDKPTGAAFKAEVLNREYPFSELGKEHAPDKSREDPFGASGKHGHRLTATEVQAEIDAGRVKLPGRLKPHAHERSEFDAAGFDQHGRNTDDL